MSVRSFWSSTGLVTLGVVTVAIGLIISGSMGAGTWICLAGALVAQCGVLFGGSSRQHNRQLDDAESGVQQLQEQQQEFEEWRNVQRELIRQESDRVEERNRELRQRIGRFQEFAEYPTSTDPEFNNHESLIRLSQQDREVNDLLEQEAQRVYERIRNNDYSINGQVNLDLIRDDALDLVSRVARVYAPDSANPLLETSFEQLARAFSRICLQSLVLLEQLPLDVKQYNINELHSYLRKAVQAYGAYQKAAPWLKRLTRGAYVGRIASGANPVTLGAWWLATELGRRGTQKLVENVVDRQAIAALHDVVTVVGVEIANIYGPGYRQRDAAWIYGAELVELLASFPSSRDSVIAALREVTALPLRCEYDRIFLYRCIASHRAAGLRIADPAILHREVREDIANRLETFYRQHIHGKTTETEAAWKQEVERRFDLKLHVGAPPEAGQEDRLTVQACQAVHAFLLTVMHVDARRAQQLLEESSVFMGLSEQNRTELLAQISDNSASPLSFNPPDLDPAHSVTSIFLTSLMNSAVLGGACDENVEQLLMETACYFRRSRDEAETLLYAAYVNVLASHTASDVPRVDGVTARAILKKRQQGERLVAVYSSVQIPAVAEHTQSMCVLAVLNIEDDLQDEETQSTAGGDKPSVADTQSSSPACTHRAILVDVNSDSDDPIWCSDASVTITRRKGILVDDCVIGGGCWTESQPGSILIEGSIVGRGFHRYFAPLLNLTGSQPG